MEKKKFNFKEKLNHFWSQGKKGSKKANGKELSDFERGMNVGRAKQMSQSVYVYYKKNPDKITSEMKATGNSIYTKNKAAREAYNAKTGKKNAK